MTTTNASPVLLDFPDRFETERLHVRLPLPGDGAEVNRAIVESLDMLKPWMIFAQSAPVLEHTEHNLREAHIKFLQRSDLRWLAFHKETGELAVSSGLHRIDWDARRFEIGYWVRSTYAGQGLVTEAVSGIEQFAIRELQANRIEIRCDLNNVRSAKVAERLGYTLEGILRGNSWDMEGKNLVSTKIYAKVKGIEFE